MKRRQFLQITGVGTLGLAVVGVGAREQRIQRVVKVYQSQSKFGEVEIVTDRWTKDTFDDAVSGMLARGGWQPDLVLVPPGPYRHLSSFLDT